MYLLDVLHAQWIIIAVGGGLIVMLGVILFFYAGWRPKEVEEMVHDPIRNRRDFLRWLLGAFPWILIVTILVILVWSFVYPIMKSGSPPNW